MLMRFDLHPIVELKKKIGRCWWEGEALMYDVIVYFERFGL